MNTTSFSLIFQKVINEYHIKDNVDTVKSIGYEEGSFDYLLYDKCWTDTVQWHLEDIIREPNIDPKKALEIKRRIDKSNQYRTDIVEKIDDYIFEKFKDVNMKSDAKLNTETPGWAIDRLSILKLKYFHMHQETLRDEAGKEHVEKAKMKLNVLHQQNEDLSIAIDQLLTDLKEGKVFAKTYKQMKMYNDPSLNPMLRKK